MHGSSSSSERPRVHSFVSVHLSTETPKLMSHSERAVIFAGLTGGLLLGAVLFRRGSVADGAPAAPQTVRAATPQPSGPAAARDDDLAALQARVAELEKKRLAKRIAALESETAETVVPKQRQRVEPAQESVAVVPETAPAADTADSAGTATLRYWNELNDVISREAAMRTAPANLTAASAAGFVSSRIQAGKFASTAIEQLNQNGVDADALSLGKELAAWYRDEISLNERAKSLLGSTDVAARKGSAGNTWRSGEEQHRLKCEAINRRGEELRTRFSRKYGLTFPALN